MKIIILFIILLFFGCPLGPENVFVIDTGWFEIKESKVGYSNQTEWGEMNQWRIILNDDYMDIKKPIYIRQARFMLWFKDDHPKQNIGFWFAAPVYNMELKKNKKFIEYVFPLDRKCSVTSCGVFTNLHGLVRLKVIFYH